MFKQDGLNALKILIQVAKTVGDGSIEKYFNGFTQESVGAFDMVEALVGYEELQQDEKMYSELQEEENIFAVLFYIKTALNHDKKAKKFFSRVFCKEHTRGMRYPEYVDSILDKKRKIFTRILSDNKHKYFEGSHLSD